MFTLLGCLENISLNWRTGTDPERYGFLGRYGFLEIFRVLTASIKNLWKVGATFLSFEMIFSF